MQQNHLTLPSTKPGWVQLAPQYGGKEQVGDVFTGFISLARRENGSIHLQEHRGRGTLQSNLS